MRRAEPDSPAPIGAPRTNVRELVGTCVYTPIPSKASFQVVLSTSLPIYLFYFLKDFIFGERGREEERGRETLMFARDTSIDCLSHTRYWGPGLQPKCVP